MSQVVKSFLGQRLEGLPLALEGAQKDEFPTLTMAGGGGRWMESVSERGKEREGELAGQWGERIPLPPLSSPAFFSFPPVY